MTLRLVLSFATGAVSLLALWLIGSRRVAGHWLGLANQLLWLALALETGAYGLLPLCAAYALVYGRNIRNWSR